MISENKVIELAKNHSEEFYFEHILFTQKDLVKFANALHDEFIKSLGEPYGYEAKTADGEIELVYQQAVHKYKWVKEEDIIQKLYALPNDELKS